MSPTARAVAAIRSQIFGLGREIYERVNVSYQTGSPLFSNMLQESPCQLSLIVTPSPFQIPPLRETLSHLVPYYHIFLYPNSSLCCLPPANHAEGNILSELSEITGFKRHPIISTFKTAEAIVYFLPRLERSTLNQQLAIAVEDIYQIASETTRPLVISCPDWRVGRRRTESPLEKEQADPSASILNGFGATLRNWGCSLRFDPGEEATFIGKPISAVTRDPHQAFRCIAGGIPTACLGPTTYMSKICPRNLDLYLSGNWPFNNALREDLLNETARLQWTQEQVETGELVSSYERTINSSFVHYRKRIAQREQTPVSISSAETGDIRVCNVQLKLDPAWEKERQLQDWFEKRCSYPAAALILWTFSHTIRPQDCVLVVGAGTGFSSLLAIGGGAAEVIAFEPNAELTGRLEQFASEGVQLSRIALASENGKGVLYQSEIDRLNASLAINAVLRPNGAITEVKSCEVQCMKLDDVCPEVNFDVIYIDSVGTVSDVLEGARQSISRSKPRAIIVTLSQVEQFECLSLLHSFYQSHASIECSPDGMGRLMPGDLLQCAQTEPRSYVFYDNVSIFPFGGKWSAPEEPRWAKGPALS